jgi:hypothetical protein
LINVYIASIANSEWMREMNPIKSCRESYEAEGKTNGSRRAEAKTQWNGEIHK